MKKLFVILIVALVVLTSASAFKFKSVGIETGAGIFTTADMVIDEVSKDFEVYARLGYAGTLDAGIGVQYRVADINLKHNTIAVKPGLHLLFDFSSSFVFSLLLGCEFSYDAGNLEAFVRPEFGIAIFKGGQYYPWGIEAGVAYLF